MVDVAKPLNFVFEDQKWDLYTRFRPPYTKPVFDHIYAYHEKHHGQFSEALDIGAGNGIITKNFLDKFEHVTFSDVGEQYVEQAKASFSQVPSEKISFVRMGFGEIESGKLPSKGLDLAAAATCLHFLGRERETFLPRMAKVIKPGGTFVAIQYTISASFPPSEPGKEEFDAVLDAMMAYAYGNLVKNDEDGPGGLMTARLDYLNFEPDLWTDVRRIHALYDNVAISADTVRQESNVKKDVESVEFFEDDGIIFVDANYDWLYGFWTNLYPAMDTKTICKDQLATLKEAMGDRTVRLKWPFDLVLATRK